SEDAKSYASGHEADRPGAYQAGAGLVGKLGSSQSKHEGQSIDCERIGHDAKDGDQRHAHQHHGYHGPAPSRFARIAAASLLRSGTDSIMPIRAPSADHRRRSVVILEGYSVAVVLRFFVFGPPLAADCRIQAGWNITALPADSRHLSFSQHFVIDHSGGF